MNIHVCSLAIPASVPTCNVLQNYVGKGTYRIRVEVTAANNNMVFFFLKETSRIFCLNEIIWGSWCLFLFIAS